MNKTIKSFVLSAFFFSLVASADVGHFVGNGGEGVWVQGHLYLRDLYELGVTEKTYSGSLVDSEVASEVAKMDLLENTFSNQKLILKLSDLQRLYPHLGFYVAQAIRSYDWVLTDLQLAPIPDDTPIVAQAERVTIANRYLSSIRVQRALWESLPEDHKVALLIHEGLYSLNRYVCQDNSIVGCSQSGQFVRDLVGKLFKKDLSTDPGFSLAFLRSNLGLPQRFYDDSSCFTSEDGAQFSIQDAVTGKVRQNFALAKEDLLDASTRGLQVKNFCNSVAFDASHEVMNIRMTRAPFVKHLVYYAEVGGAMQMAISFNSRKGLLVDVQAQKLSTPAGCQQYLSKLSDDWFDDRTSFPGRDNSCVAQPPAM